MKSKCAAIDSFLFFLTLCLAPLSASSQVFKCVDANGKVTYGNEGGSAKGCKALSNEQSISTISMRPNPSSATSSPATFPKVSDEAQRERDKARRQVLEKELDEEQSKLEEARSELAEQEASFQGGEAFVVRDANGGVRRGVNPQKKLERLEPYKEAVAQRERNIEALNQELSRLR